MNSLYKALLAPLGLRVEALSRLPYLCEGDLNSGYYVLSDAVLLVTEDQDIPAGQVICQWDPHSVPILSEVGGRARFEDCIEGQSIRTETEASGKVRKTIIEHKGDLHPQIVLEDGTGKILDFYYMPERASIEVEEGQQIAAGSVIDPESLAKMGLVRKSASARVKILGQGDVTSSLTVKAHAVSESARAKIEARGGRVELLGAAVVSGS